MSGSCSNLRSQGAKFKKNNGPTIIFKTKLMRPGTATGFRTDSENIG